MSPTPKDPVTPTVTVYEFELFDSHRRSWKKAGQLGTLDAITRLGGVPHKTTGLVVDATMVDETGLLTPAQKVAYGDRPGENG
jgi:hypothetical protein